MADRQVLPRPDLLPIEIVQPRDAGPIHADTGIAEEHGIDAGRDGIVGAPPESPPCDAVMAI